MNVINRKGGLLLNNLLGIAGGCLMWMTMTSRAYEMLIIGRFIIGVHCGEGDLGFSYIENIELSISLSQIMGRLLKCVGNISLPSVPPMTI